MSGMGSSNSLHLLPFGIPTLIIAEDPQLISAAAAAYAHWLAEAPVGEPEIELRLETASPTTTGVCLDIAVDGSRLGLKGTEAEGDADAVSGKAAVRVSGEAAMDVTRFAEVVDTVLLFILARRDRTPVHASAFIAADEAMVLAGPSGSGKSTLALAAAERSYPVLSDDMVFVQREPSFALWGFPRPIHVFPDDAPAGDHPTRLRNSKVKAAVPLQATALKAERARLILLEPGTELALRAIDRAEAVEALMNLDAGFNLLQQESRAALEALASGGAWRLTLADDPVAAIAFLLSEFPDA